MRSSGAAARRRRRSACVWAVVLACAIAAPPHALGAEAPPLPAGRGTVRRLEMRAPSLEQERRTVRVYLPPGYADDPLRRYPVIYMLHGSPGSDGNWLNLGDADATADSLIAAGRIPPVILVFPNGIGLGLLGRSLYLNSYDGRSRIEDYIVRDVVAWTDSMFRTRARSGERGIIGLSDGATAALDMTFRHPDVFGACGGHSGQYRLRKEMGEGAFLGPEPGASRRLDAHSPTLYVDGIAARLRGVPIYFDIGLSDENLEDNRALDRKLTALEVPHTYNEFPGSHTWKFWRTHLRDSLIAVTAGMGN